jgi:pimeloyl-ACP methyl ester carboxylesterase
MSVVTLDPRAFGSERAELATGVRLAYVRAGAGGYPLVLIHGYPETKRIWWRNIEPLAGCGFEVIAPDLRGFGESAPAPDGHYDPSAFARDLYALVHEVLGHNRCSIVAGDLGAMVAIDFALRFPGFVERQVIFATALPALGERYRRAGIPRDPPRRARPEADYFLRQGLEADELIEELPSRESRLEYVASFYRDRGWAGQEGFTVEEARFMAEPFADRERLRTSWAPYEVAMGVRRPSDRPRWDEPCPVPTLALYGAEDGVVLPSFMKKAKVAFPQCVGPFVVPECGHFMQWEQAETLNQAVAHFVNPS